MTRREYAMMFIGMVCGSVVTAVVVALVLGTLGATT